MLRLLFAWWLHPTVMGASVYIDNTSPRHDDRGMIMDIHDGNLVQWEAGGRYYWYGEEHPIEIRHRSPHDAPCCTQRDDDWLTPARARAGMGYQNCTLERIYMPPQYCVGVYQEFGGCGFRDDHALNVYSSSDLVTWRFEGDALPFGARPRGIYFRPKVVYDARAGEYVLWINYLRQQSRLSWPADTPLQSYMSNISAVVGKATSPAGPFAIVNPWARLQVDHIGDFAILVDNDGSSAYIAYDVRDHWRQPNLAAHGTHVQPSTRMPLAPERASPSHARRHGTTGTAYA